MPPDPHLRRLLDQLGYHIAARENGWHECLVIGDGETWLGHGLGPEAALADAVRKACPSHLAQVLLERALAAEVERRDDPAPSAAASSPEASTASPSTAELVPAPAHVEPPPEPSAPAPIVEPEPSPAPSGISHTAAMEPPKLLLTNRHAKHESRPRISEWEAIVDLRELRAKIESDRDELAVSAPIRQRLVLLAWIARARSYQEAVPYDSDVQAAVRGLAGLLGSLAREWWPGSVPALQLAARPNDSTKTLPNPPKEPPTTWAEVADLAERAVADIEREDRSKGLDEYGWADAVRLHPPPKRPDHLLAELVADVERVSGPLGGLPGDGMFPEPEQGLHLARQARWLRGAVEDVTTWGAVVGRLRYWASKYKRDLPDLARVLDPTFRPERPWAHLVGAEGASPPTNTPDPQREAELQNVLADAPKPDASPDRETIRAWLSRALDFTDTHAVASLMRPFESVVLTLQPQDFPGTGRRIRRRLTKLHEALAGEPVNDAQAVSKPIEQPPDDKPRNGNTMAASPAVLSRTRGKAALFISNRADPDLRDRLVEACAFSKLDWVEAEPRRIDAVADAVTAGKYDLVLSATGFLDHSVDTKLARACRGADVPYVRVHKGRPAASLRALERDLGGRVTERRA